MKTLPLKILIENVQLMPSLKRWIVLAIFMNVIFSLFDLIFVVFFSLAINKFLKIQSNYSFALFDSFSTFEFLIVVFLFLVVKTFLQYKFNRYIFLSLAEKAAILGKFLTYQVFSSRSRVDIDMSSQEIAHGTQQGVSAKIVGGVGNSITLISEYFLFLVMFIAISWVSLVFSFLIFAYISLLSILVIKLLGKHIHVNARKSANLSVSTLESIQDLFYIQEVASPANNYLSLLKRLDEKRLETMKLVGIQNILSQVPKYVFDIAIILGLFIVFIGQYLFQLNISDILPVFLAAFSRMIPSALKIQGIWANLRVAESSAIFTNRLINTIPSKDINTIPSKEIFRDHVSNDVVESAPSIKVKNLSFKYFGSTEEEIIKDLNFEFSGPGVLLLKGDNGAGKSTLISLIAGNLVPSKGEILIDKCSPVDYCTKLGNSIGYVPQYTHLISGDLIENITFFKSEVDQNLLTHVISLCGLDRIRDTRKELKTDSLSGGQKQRLSLARALYSKSSILLMDEPNNALDPESSEIFLKVLQISRSSKTIVIISHNPEWQALADNIIELS